MKNINRRNLLKLASTGLGAAAVTTAMSPKVHAWVPRNPGGPSAGKKFLHIIQRGGNDGLNTIFPRVSGDASRTLYEVLRPTLKQTSNLNVNSFAGAHPRLQSLFNGGPWGGSGGDLAFVHRVGYTDHNRSHFQSMRYMETAIHAGVGGDRGWINRLAQEVGGTSDLLSVSMSNALMQSMSGTPASVHMRSIESFRLDQRRNPATGNSHNNYEKLIRVDGSGLNANHNLLGQAYNQAAVAAHTWDDDSHDSGQALAGALNEAKSITPYTSSSPWTGNQDWEWPTSEAAVLAYNSSLSMAEADQQLPVDGAVFAFFRAARDATRLLRETDCQIAAIEIGGWDTHAFQAVQHGNLLASLAHALRSIRQDCLGGIWDDLVVMVETEFGRTSQENGSVGTDHGQASLVMLMGPPVDGGVKNCDSSWNTVPGNNPIIGIDRRFLSPAVDYLRIREELAINHFGLTQAASDIVLPALAAGSGYTPVSGANPGYI